jgi:RAB protein geranylgeranyltransferase component A
MLLRSCRHARTATQLWERFRPGQTPPASLGASRDYNVDMVPKFIMANGNLVKVGTVVG